MDELEKKGNHVFVYGSLKHGYGNHRLLETSFLIGEGITNSQNFYMISYHDAFPGIARNSSILEDGFFIRGEIYLVDNKVLQSLDSLEGNGIFYQRELVPIKHNFSNSIIECWTYILLVEERELEYFGTRTVSQRIDIDPETKICTWV